MQFNLIKTVLEIIETLVWSNIKRVYTFLKHFWGGFCHFLIQNNQKHTFSFRPFTSDFAYFMSIISKTTICLVIKKLKPSNVCISSDIFEENALQNTLCWCLEPNLEQDSLCIYMKSMKISSKSDSLSSISQSGVDFKHI